MNNIYLGFWEILALDAPPWSRAGTGEAIFMYQLLVLESGLWSISFQWRKEWKFLRPTLIGVNFSQHPHSSAKRVELVRSIFSQVDKSLPDDGLHLKCCAQILRRPKPTCHSTSWPFFQKSHSPNLPLLLFLITPVFHSSRESFVLAKGKCRHSCWHFISTSRST